ncbi:MAG: radical SAM protein [Melioribacteraceae bacterium]|nr:radical SAM protein [Melioribacteraceae bacterium]
MSIVFGPIPSRRLGRSLGVNNIPPKVCSYSCIYCQVGITDSMLAHRTEYYRPNEIFEAVSEKVNQLIKAGEQIDYITFVPDGEPTLDINLGKSIDLVKSFGIKIAVITNASLLWRPDVLDDLKLADWVSVKVDSVYQNIWRKINRPHGKLNFERVLNGIEKFANEYEGTLVTETMLVRHVNDNLESLNKTAKFIKKIKPKKSYILVPTRPPAEKNVEIPRENSLNIAYQIFNSYLSDAEFLFSGEGIDFTYLDEVESELLSIVAVHPMTKDAVEDFLNKADSEWFVIENLINENKLKEVTYSGRKYYIKSFEKDHVNVNS